jgi:hypothetical protein
MSQRHGSIVIDDASEAEARAMARAMNTGELPPKSAPYYERVKKLAEMYWAAKNQHGEGRS